MPGIPPLVICAISLWSGSALAYVQSEHLENDIQVCLIALFLAGSLVIGILLAFKRRIFLAIALFMFIGLLIGEASSLSYHLKSLGLPQNGTYDMTLLEDPKESSRGSYAKVEVKLSNGDVKATAFFESDPELLYGSRIRSKCSFSRIKDEYLDSSYLSFVNYQVNLSNIEKTDVPFPEKLIHDLRSLALSRIKEHAGNEAGILQALICGYRPTIQSEGTYENYKLCGIAHIVAVSGAHLAIVTMALGILLKAIGMPRRPYIAISIFFILSYLCFAGIPISAVRAAIMCVLFLISGVAGRRNSTLNSLAVCVILFILFDPSSCVSISLFLSAASTMGIVLFANMLSEWSYELPKFVQNLFAQPLALTISSNISTLPFSVATFGVLPIVSPISNLLIAPLFTFVCVSGLLALTISMAIPELSNLLIAFPAFFASFMNGIASYLSGMPNSHIEVQPPLAPMIFLSVTACIGLLYFKPKIKGAYILLPFAILLVFIGFGSFRLPNVSADRLVMLDVGQGDALILQSEGSTLLIDTGNETNKLKASLSYAGISEIDAVSISHPDGDHCQSLTSIDCITEDAKFICSRDMLFCGCSKCSDVINKARNIFGEEDIVGLNESERFKVGSFSIEVLWPIDYTDEGGNSDSLCLLASIDANHDGEDDWKALFTGDAERDSLEKIASDVGDIDVLKVGHHGSKSSLTKDLFMALNPEYALISVGKGNSYGHPTDEILRILDSGNTEVLRTDENGVVELDFSEKGITVSKQH